MTTIEQMINKAAEEQDRESERFTDSLRSQVELFHNHYQAVIYNSEKATKEEIEIEIENIIKSVQGCTIARSVRIYLKVKNKPSLLVKTVRIYKN